MISPEQRFVGKHLTIDVQSRKGVLEKVEGKRERNRDRERERKRKRKKEREREIEI